MDLGSLAVGIVGLVSLFDTCLSALDKFDSWKDFGNESHALSTQFKAHKLRLVKWGQAVGLESNDGKLSRKHNELLDDPQTFSLVKELLLAIRRTCRDDDDIFQSPASRISKRPVENHPSDSHAPSNTTRESKRGRIVWALTGQKKRIEQIQRFSELVGALHSLIPVNRDNGIILSDAIYSRSIETNYLISWLSRSRALV